MLISVSDQRVKRQLLQSRQLANAHTHTLTHALTHTHTHTHILEKIHDKCKQKDSRQKTHLPYLFSW